MGIQITADLVRRQIYDSVPLGWGLRFYLSALILILLVGGPHVE